jgi:hypothetical protein
MKPKISITNSKLSGQIPSINLPAVKTCRANAPCSHLCYATKGNFLYPKVKESHIYNLACFINDSAEYFKSIHDFLINGLTTYKYFRFHSSGDIPNNEYLLGMVNLALSCKKVKFLAFTKKFELVNNFLASGGVIPKNLNIVFSAWDKNFKIDNPYNLPVTYVNFKKHEENPVIPKNAFPCAGKCYNCQKC